MPPKRRPGPNDVPMFDVEQSVQHGYHPELGDQPTVTTEFTVHDFTDQPPAPQAAAPTQPEIIYGEPGAYMDLAERARVLRGLIPVIAEHAKLEKLPTGLHTEEGPEIQARLERKGKPVMRRLREVADHKEVNERLIWKNVYEDLGYEAVSKAYPEFVSNGTRNASEDRYRMLEKFGARKRKEREAFLKNLNDGTYPEKSRKPRKR